MNVAAVLLLLIPGDFALRRLRSTVEQINLKANTAVAAAESAIETANRTERSLVDVREALMSRQSAEFEAELDVYRQIAIDPARRTLLAALRKATAAGIVSASGVRSPIWETDLHYRYVIDSGADEFAVHIEQDDGTVVSTTPWPPPMTPDDFYQSLVEAVREAGADLGVLLNDPTESVSALSEMLVDVSKLRSQELLGHRDDLRQIIERVDGWYFTERAVFPSNNVSYRIDRERLGDPMWEEHLRSKGWHGAVTMIPFGRRLYGIAGAR